jgi:hypothetical protein
MFLFNRQKKFSVSERVFILSCLLSLTGLLLTHPSYGQLFDGTCAEKTYFDLTTTNQSSYCQVCPANRLPFINPSKFLATSDISFVWTDNKTYSFQEYAGPGNQVSLGLYNVTDNGGGAPDCYWSPSGVNDNKCILQVNAQGTNQWITGVDQDRINLCNAALAKVAAIGCVTRQSQAVFLKIDCSNCLPGLSGQNCDVCTNGANNPKTGCSICPQGKSMIAGTCQTSPSCPTTGGLKTFTRQSRTQ